jgi:nitroreductase
MLVSRSPETYTSIRNLRTVRAFSSAPLVDDDLSGILEAGRWTGSSKNRQSWVFVVVRDRAQIERLAACGEFTQPLLDCAAVVAPVALPDLAQWDLGRVAQNMMLGAAAVGVGTCPVSLQREAEALSVLGCSPDFYVRTVLACGYPDETAEREGRAAFPLGGRKPLSELVHYDRYSSAGQP